MHIRAHLLSRCEHWQPQPIFHIRCISMNVPASFDKLVLAIFVLLCLFCTIDTRQFVYPALSKTLLMEAGIMLLGLCVLGHIIFVHAGDAGRRVHLNVCCLFVFVWAIYIAAHGIISDVCEEYRSSYLCLCLLAVIPLSYFNNMGVLRRSDIERGLLMMAIVHIVYVYGQLMGFIASGNKYFPVTGCNENPTSTALCLVGCMPLIVRHMRGTRYRLPLLFVLLLSFVAVLLLRCRTAYVGLAMEIVVWFALHCKDKNIRLTSILRNKKWLFGCVLLLVAVSAVKLYDMKRESSNGRKLVWTISSAMILEKPLGYGYGLFERYYNLRQADYFRSDTSTVSERHRADYTTVAYNDYIEHGVEGGVIGMLFLVAFYVLLFYQAVCHRQKDDAAVVAAFAVMSLTNFIYTSIQAWWILMCYASFVSVYSHNIPIRNRMYGNIILVVALLLVVVSGIRQLPKVYSQIKLARYSRALSHGDVVLNDDILSLQSTIGSSEAYWRLRARKYIGDNDFAQAIIAIRNARAYSSNPLLLKMEYRCRMSLRDTVGAMSMVDTICMMLPSKLMPKHILMNYYSQKSNKSTALRYAHDILSTGEKVKSEQSSLIITKAQEYIRENEK